MHAQLIDFIQLKTFRFSWHVIAHVLGYATKFQESSPLKFVTLLHIVALVLDGSMCIILHFSILLHSKSLLIAVCHLRMTQLGRNML
jgi:hypothetical protein